MSKTKITLAAVGGISGVAVLAAGVFLYLQMSARTTALEGDEETDGLETVQAKAERLMRQTVRPCDESVKELAASRVEILAWKDETFRFASRGDRPITELSDAAFKEFLIQDSKRLLGLPQGTTNKTLEATFEFGPFKSYISEGKMPELENLKTLQRNWDDLALIIETLSSCGIARVTAIDLAKATVSQEEAAPAKTNKKAKKTKKSAEPAFKPASFTYSVSCLARPAAFVKALNAFQTIERFVAVDDFSIRRGKDELAEALGGDKREEAAPTSRRGRRRAARAEEEDEKKSEETGILTLADPQKEQPFEVTLTLTVHDFRSLEETPKEEEEK